MREMRRSIRRSLLLLVAAAGAAGAAGASTPAPAAAVSDLAVLKQLHQLLASNNATRDDMERLIQQHGQVSPGPNGSTVIRFPGNATLLHREIVREQIEVRRAGEEAAAAAAEAAAAAASAAAAAKEGAAAAGVVSGGGGGRPLPPPPRRPGEPVVARQVPFYPPTPAPAAGGTPAPSVAPPRPSSPPPPPLSSLRAPSSPGGASTSAPASPSSAAAAPTFGGEGVVVKDHIVVNGTVVRDYWAGDAAGEKSALPLPSPPPPLAAPPTATRRKVECPPDFELSGKVCVKVEAVAAEATCPPGSEPSAPASSGAPSCVVSAPGRLACLPGLSVTPEGRCEVPREGVQPRPVCERGTLEAEGCRVTAEPELGCPEPGFEPAAGGLCVRASPIEKVCPPGFRMSGKDCARRAEVAAARICPPDTALVNDECLRHVPVPPFCEDGYTLAGEECVAQLAREAAECPAGFSFDAAAAVCLRETVTPAAELCPPGFGVETGRCVRRTPRPPACPPGARELPTGECESEAPPVPGCAGEDEELRGDGCVTERFYVADLVCDEDAGFTLYKGKCKKVDSAPAPYHCTVGELREDGRGRAVCVERRLTPVRVTCPRGTAMTDAGDCAREVPYDCSQAVTTTECEMPAFVAFLLPERRSGSSGGAVQGVGAPAPGLAEGAPAAAPSAGAYDSPAINYKAKPSAAAAAAQPHFKGAVPEKDASGPESKEPVCRQVKRIVPRTCSRVELAQPARSCRPGSAYSEADDACAGEIVLGAIRACEDVAGAFDAETASCVRLQSVPPQKRCPQGELDDGGHVCVAVTSRPADFLCQPPAVARGDHCAVLMERVAVPEQVEEAEPRLACDEGSELVDRTCVVRDSINRPHQCPTNSVERRGVCVVTTPVIYPHPLIIRVAPTQFCPPGATAAGPGDARCYAIEKAESIYACRDGVHRGGRCIAERPLQPLPPQVTFEPPQPVCPPGFETRGNRCFTDTTFAPFVQCPPGFASPPVAALLADASPPSCTRPVPAALRCSLGAFLSPDATQCLARREIAPRVTEIKVCTKGVEGC